LKNGQLSSNQRREGEQDHHRDDEDVPGVERHEVEPHAGRAAFEHADDQFDCGCDRRHLDEAEAEHPDVRAEPTQIGPRRQRRIHEPAAIRRGIEEDRSRDEHAADQEAPIAKAREPREGQVACAEQLWQQDDRDRLEHRHSEQEHHHRAVQREQLVKRVRGDEIVVRHRQLRAHDQREHACEQHEAERGQRVPDADPVIVDVGPAEEPAARRFPDLAQAILLALSDGGIVLVGGDIGRTVGRHFSP
jgi:hypothetical protein